MNSREKYGLWVFAALFVILVIVAATSMNEQRGTLTMALGKGAYVWVLSLVLFTSLTTWWQSVKNGGRPALVSSVVALAIAAICGWLLIKSHAQMRGQAPDPNFHAVVTDMQQTMTPANAPELRIGNREQRVRAFANSPTLANSDLGRDQRARKAFVAKTLALRDQLNETAKRTDWDAILDPTRIASDKNMAQSIVMVDAMKVATNAYVTQMHDLVDDLPAGLKQGASTTKMKELMFEALALQQQETNQVGDVIVFLAKTNGRWSVDQNHILFQRQQDSDKYNENLHKSFATDSKLQAVEKERLARFKEGLKRLERLNHQ